MIYSFEDFTLNSELLELRRDGEAVELEPQVFQLLLLLIENRNRVVGKEELIKEVWRGRIVSDSALNSRINAARRAVGDDGRMQSLIKTFPRRGFRFIGNVQEQSAGSDAADRESSTTDPTKVLSPAAGDKPVVVVLPFHCLGDDEEFGEGLESMLITELSHRTGVEIIGRQAAQCLSTRPVDFTQIRNDVDADYALTGTVHRIGKRVRILVELCETHHGRQIWSERYDRELGDAFSLQDELARLILMASRWNMTAYDGERLARSPKSRLSMADRLSMAAQYFYTPTPESYQAAMDLLDGVLRDEPRHAMALSMRAFAAYVSSTLRVAPMSVEQCEYSKRMADWALDQNERSDFSHWVRGTLALNLDRDHDMAMAHANRACEINTHYAPALRLKGETLCFSGEPVAGIAMLEELVASDPRAPGNAIAYWDMALGHFATGGMSDALNAIDEALLRIRTMPDFYLVRVAVLAELGRLEEAGPLVDHLTARYDGVRLPQVRRPPFKDNRLIEKYVEALGTAGIPK